MKKLFPVLLFISASTTSCLPAKQVAKSVIDIGLALCIANHADVMDEKALRDICRWTDELAPVVKDLLSARKAGLEKASKAGACAK